MRLPIYASACPGARPGSIPTCRSAGAVGNDGYCLPLALHLMPTNPASPAPIKSSEAGSGTLLLVSRSDCILTVPVSRATPASLKKSNVAIVSAVPSSIRPHPNIGHDPSAPGTSRSDVWVRVKATWKGLGAAVTRMSNWSLIVTPPGSPIVTGGRVNTAEPPSEEVIVRVVAKKVNSAELVPVGEAKVKVLRVPPSGSVAVRVVVAMTG